MVVLLGLWGVHGDGCSDYLSEDEDGGPEHDHQEGQQDDVEGEPQVSHVPLRFNVGGLRIHRVHGSFGQLLILWLISFTAASTPLLNEACLPMGDAALKSASVSDG